MNLVLVSQILEVRIKSIEYFEGNNLVIKYILTHLYDLIRSDPKLD
jgi:hypothetical protein